MGSVAWQRLDLPGMEWAEYDGSGIAGTVLIVDAVPCRIEYAVDLDATGKTRHLQMNTRVGAVERQWMITNDGEGAWQVNGAETLNVPGCVDVDLSFSPCTNRLPIRRLALAVGERRELTVAWFRFPELDLVRADQSYERLGEREYRFRQDDFEATLRMNAEGMVEEYEGLWRLLGRT